MRTNYVIEREFEYRVKKHMEKQGYFCRRSAGSKFPDLICLKKGKGFFVECKSVGKLSKEEILKVANLYAKHYVVTYLATPERISKMGKKMGVKLILPEIIKQYSKDEFFRMFGLNNE